jgi:hypothetical protein
MPIQVEDVLATYGKRDDDGDRDFRVHAKVSVSGDDQVDMVRMSAVFKNGQGLPVLTEEVEEDVDLEDGDSETVEGYTYSNYNDLNDATASVTVNAYEQRRTQVGSVTIKGTGQISGSADRVEICPGLTLTGWSVQIEKADDDGDCKVNLIATLQNDSARPVDKAVVRTRFLTRKDKEIIALEEFQSIPAMQHKTIEDNTYISANKAKKEMRVVVTIETYFLMGSETKDVGLEKDRKSQD